MHTTSSNDRNSRIWQTPVYVRIGHGSSETIAGPETALTYLLNRWPTERGPHYEHARSACLMAVDKQGSADIAREAFIAAAIEAYILA